MDKYIMSRLEALEAKIQAQDEDRGPEDLFGRYYDELPPSDRWRWWRYMYCNHMPFRKLEDYERYELAHTVEHLFPLGYELYTSPYVPTAQSGALTVAFGDFKNYWIGDRAGRTVQRLNELYATNGQIGYVATERVDGKVILPEAIQLLQQA